MSRQPPILTAFCGEQGDAPGATRARRHTYLTEAPRMVDFLTSQGVKLTRVSAWPDYYDDRPGGSTAGRTVVAELFNVNELGPWKSKLRPGFLTLPAMLEEALELPKFRRSWKARGILLKVVGRAIVRCADGQALGVGRQRTAGAYAAGGPALPVSEIRTESPVRELIVENGAVTGVLTVRDGKPWRVGARLGVLVNAGGFAHNQRMRDQYQPGTSSSWSSAAPGDTGEMIEEMMRHGAAVAQMEEMVGQQTTLAPGSENDDIKPVSAENDRVAARDPRRPDRGALHERGRLLHGVLQADAGAQ